MIKKLTLTICLFFALISLQAQSSEGRVFEITSRVKIYLPETNNAVLEGNERFIQIGLLGNQTDKDELIGYMDRFVVNDKDMTIQVVSTISEEFIDYYKFYLDPLYDANDFQKMLEMLQVKTYFIGRNEYPVNTFSNTILAYIKKKS
jgi:hypothetical protein